MYTYIIILVDKERKLTIMKKYLRFKNLPENERSFNFIEEKYEDGISVFEIVDGKPYLPTLELLGSFASRNYDPTYIVTGDVVGIGFDDEPLLKNVKIIKEIKIDVHAISMDILNQKFQRIKKLNYYQGIYDIWKDTDTLYRNIKTGEISKSNFFYPDDWEEISHETYWKYDGLAFYDPIDGFDTVTGTQRLIERGKNENK